MREKYHRTFLFLIPFLISSVHCQLSCHRIPTSFCCTSRIRDQCPEQCASVQCGTDFIHSLFSTDGSRRPAPSGAHDGNANIGGTGSVDNLRSAFGSAGDSDPSITSFEKPDQSVPGAATWNSNSGDARIGAQKATTTPAPTGFPTLIPFSSEPWTTGTQTPLAPAASSAVPEIQAPSRIPGPELPVRIPAPTMSPWNPSSRRNAHRHRTTPDPRIIRPPESLVVIGDYDEDEPPSENAVVDSPQPFVTSPPPAQPLFPQQTPPPPASPLISNSGDVFARSRKEISGAPDSEQQSGSAATLSGSSHEWKVSIIPRGQNKKPANVKSIPPFTIDGKADERFNKFYRTIDSVINNLDLTNGGNLHEREGEPQIRLEGSTGNSKDLSVESSAAVIVPRTTVAPGVTNKVSVIPFRPLHFTAPPRNGPPGVAPPKGAAGNEQCGVSPDFTPCVSNEIASKSLLECCKRKNLPAGCQQLCRYDITQTEIRAAMDRGQCGIFNVAPFLECASQGKDNSECCRHRGIVQKTGPQCEQFCRPAQGLSSLGVQHIVCGNAVGDMLHCHHSGVRI
ncbi:uncharacterized protein CELE_Y57G11C.42 [Caenorhabditis elegans]|uniref:Domain of unknown function DB domain-containing protein n=1 Tax=Caenorhabditis elegans TaxID=6239 RepID=H9G364_CAEEL|nr:protein of unknown function DB domain-containing protein [Caenorhabditis elegans]CCG28149.1 Domain of unknown function DB domain-containing protein [Caenorhabditis elegans]|eukprot:NP_001255824.1 Uncharacterized protein CELE_Y57G11C.42 [Caenorhabditis elegans]